MSTLEERAEELLAAVWKGQNEYRAYSNDRICEPRGGWSKEQWAEFQARVPYKAPKEFQIDRLKELVAQIRAEAIRDAAKTYWEDRTIARYPETKKWLEDLAEVEAAQDHYLTIEEQDASLAAFIEAARRQAEEGA